MKKFFFEQHLQLTLIKHPLIIFFEICFQYFLCLIHHWITGTQLIMLFYFWLIPVVPMWITFVHHLGLSIPPFYFCVKTLPAYAVHLRQGALGAKECFGFKSLVSEIYQLTPPPKSHTRSPAPWYGRARDGCACSPGGRRTPG